MCKAIGWHSQNVPQPTETISIGDLPRTRNILANPRTFCKEAHKATSYNVMYVGMCRAIGLLECIIYHGKRERDIAIEWTNLPNRIMQCSGLSIYLAIKEYEYSIILCITFNRPGLNDTVYCWCA